MKSNINSNIIIFSRAIRSGKTSQLQEWLEQHDAAGILTPDIRGQRMLYNIRNKSLHIFEVGDTFGGEMIQVGRFRFAKSAFSMAREILLQALQTPVSWLVIDEVGKLEIEQGEGLEPAVMRVVDAFRAPGGKGKLMLVIRESLLEQALNKYDLHDCIVIRENLPA